MGQGRGGPAAAIVINEVISHTLDPRTGHPVEGGPASVTVIAASTTEADAWATAIMVLGVPEGLDLAEDWGIAAMALMILARCRLNSSKLFAPRQPSVVK